MRQYRNWSFTGTALIARVRLVFGDVSVGIDIAHHLRDGRVILVQCKGP